MCLYCRAAGNLALGKSAIQSKDYHDRVASKAVDGYLGHGIPMDGAFGYCSQTPHLHAPVWILDFNSSLPVGEVWLYNRRNNKQANLNNVEVWIGENPTGFNHKGNEQCSPTSVFTYDNVTATGFPFIICCGLPGRYLFVRLPDTGYLTLCEVVAYGIGSPCARNACKWRLLFTVPARPCGCFRSCSVSSRSCKPMLSRSRAEKVCGEGSHWLRY